MLIGIGTDIIEIKRVTEAIARTPRFKERIYTQKEWAFLNESGKMGERCAGNFAVKEAFSKAIGTGFRTFNPSDVEVLREVNGRPYIALYNEAKALAAGLGITQILVSISHCNVYAVGMVTFEGRNAYESS